MWIYFSIRLMITCLFKNRGFSEEFKYDLAENVDDIINTIRSRLETTVFKSFVPSPRHVCRRAAEVVALFTNFCKHEKTFPGFRIDLVSCVKAVAIQSLKNT